ASSCWRRGTARREATGSVLRDRGLALDQLLGLAPEAVSVAMILPTSVLQDFPQPIQEGVGLVLVSELVVGHGQERQVPWGTRLVPRLSRKVGFRTGQALHRLLVLPETVVGDPDLRGGWVDGREIELRRSQT